MAPSGIKTSGSNTRITRPSVLLDKLLKKNKKIVLLYRTSLHANSLTKIICIAVKY